MGKDKSAKKAGPKTGPKKDPTAAAANQPPSWPPFKPPLPVINLEFTTPAPGYEDKITVIRNFWPKSLCRDFVAFLQGLPLTTTPGRPKRGEAVRVNDRFQVQDPDFSRKLWTETGLDDVINQDSVKHLWYV
jgi:hypothetical protein